MGMLKPADRIRSAKALEEFIGFAFEDRIEFSFDVVVLSSNGACVYYNTPCAFEHENYPNDEDSYTIDIWWTQAEKQEGKTPACGYHNFKSYFQHFSFTPRWDRYLSFSCMWREESKICIIKRENGVSNLEVIKKIVEVSPCQP